MGRDTTRRYRRKVRSNGTSVFVRKQGILSIGRSEKKGALCGDVLEIDLPQDLRQASHHQLPYRFRLALAGSDEALDKAYDRLKGLSRKQLEEIMEGVLKRIIHDHGDRLPEFSPRQLLTFLDRQYSAFGLEVLEVHQVA